VAMLAHRELAASGHPRIADNARWRLYDHVRGTLAGATAAPAAQRGDIAVQAMYATRDSVEVWLDGTRSSDLTSPRPGVDELCALLDAHRTAIAREPRWQPVLEARAAADAALHDTLRSMLPAPRDPAWPAVSVPAGRGSPEELAPVVVA